MTGPDRQLARRKYRELAPAYDRLVRPAARMRRVAVDRLALTPGEVVLDLGCGTGLSFPLIQDRIGPEGRLIGVDLSPDMLPDASWIGIGLALTSLALMPLLGRAKQRIGERMGQ